MRLSTNCVDDAGFCTYLITKLPLMSSTIRNEGVTSVDVTVVIDVEEAVEVPVISCVVVLICNVVVFRTLITLDEDVEVAVIVDVRAFVDDEAFAAAHTSIRRASNIIVKLYKYSSSLIAASFACEIGTLFVPLNIVVVTFGVAFPVNKVLL